MTVEDLLRRQHAELRDLLRDVREARGDRVEIELEALADAVELHWTLAERHLHPALALAGYPDVYRAIEAHRALVLIVRELGARCDRDPRFFAALELLAAQLEQHIVDEERAALPYLERVLTRERDRAITCAMLETIAEVENENWLGAPSAWANPGPAA